MIKYYKLLLNKICYLIFEKNSKALPELSFKVTLKTVPDLLYEVSLTDNFVATLLLLPKTSELCELTLTTSSMSETAIISLEDKDNFSSAIETKEES